MNQETRDSIDMHLFPLTAEQIAFFHDNGYLLLEKFMPPSEISWIIPVGDPLFVQHPHPDLPGRVDFPSQWEPSLREGPVIDKMISLAEQLLGPDVVFRGDWLLDKRPGHRETIWHQDEWRRDQKWPFRYVEIWLALDDADEYNGCIQVIAHSHKRGLIPRPSAEFDELVASESVFCKVPAGGCVLWTGRTLHYAAINTNGQPRRALSLSFGRQTKDKMAPFLLEQLSTPGQRAGQAQQFVVPVAEEATVTLQQIIDDPVLFRCFLSQPAGQMQLRQAMALQSQMQQIPRATRSEDGYKAPVPVQINRRLQAQNRNQKLMKERAKFHMPPHSTEE